MFGRKEIADNFGTIAGDEEFIAYCVETGAIETPRVLVTRTVCLVCGEDEEFSRFSAPIGVVRALAAMTLHTEECMGQVQFETESI